jgi:glycosyltransferase involved in cell wall biosynthesis
MISEHASPLSCIGKVDTGGQNVYVDQVARHLVTKGYQIDVFTRRNNAAAKDVVDCMPGMRVIHIKAGPESDIIKEEMLPYMPEFADNMMAFIIKHQLHYQVIHAHFFMSGMVACEIKKQLGIPFVITFHALGHIRRLYQAENDKFPIERTTIEAQIAKRADHIIAECPQDKADLLNYYQADAGKISIIPCGFNKKEFYPIAKRGARKFLGLPTREPVLLQLGRMVPRKGIDNVIRAMAHLKSAGNGTIQLIIVGGDEENMEQSSSAEFIRLRNIVNELNISNQIIFAGRKGRDMLKYYYSAADLFITTPWYEPFGITPLEAMACGTPVIGANVGGIKYSVVDGVTGALVAPDQPGELAEKVSGLLSNKAALKALGKQAIRHVNNNFTWAKVTDHLAMLYQQVIAARRNGQAIRAIIVGNDNSQAA